MITPLQKLLHPEKHSQKIDIKKVVAASKLHKQGVERYKKNILDGKTIKPIVVLKHPHEELYAVLDGHHRFYALLELGNTAIDAVVLSSRTKFLFNKTKDGWLQPTPAMTKYIHVPVLVFARYINNFIRNPKKHLKVSGEVFVKVKSGISSLKKKKN